MKEALKLALEALEYASSRIEKVDFDFEPEINAIKEALAQPEQEPVAWFTATPIQGNGNRVLYEQVSKQYNGTPDTVPLYTTPPQRKPLTLEQLRKHWQVAKVLDMTDAEIDFADYVLIARDVEALHGIKE